MIFDIASFTERGPRSQNEDALFLRIDGDTAVFAIADGLGGLGGGRKAADIALKTVEEWPSDRDLAELPFSAHSAIVSEQSVSPHADMATTLTVVRVIDRKLEGVHIGDTRCSVQRGNGIKKLTVAHTEAQRLFDAGKLSKEDFLNYPRRNILDSALGAKDALKTQNFQFDLEEHDILFLTTDGVHEKIFLKRMLEMSHGKAPEICNRIKNEVIASRPSDNFSCIVAIVHSDTQPS